MPLEKPIIPTFSLQERDRRWSLLRAPADFPEKDDKLKEGHVFILKPAARKGFMRDSIRAGDTVAIEAHGARRLGTRKLEFVAT